jgi:hypothetical protein
MLTTLIKRSLVRWRAIQAIGHDLKLVQQMTLMTIGLYNQPNGVYLPSVLY